MFLLVIAGCTTVRTEYVTAKCEIPVFPSLPTVDGGRLYDRIGADDYYTLMLREKRLTDWALEMEATLIELCR